MENAVDALKMAFGIIVFVIAIALSVSVIGQARAASEVVFHSKDKTEFYEYATEDTVIDVTQNGDRIVGIETIIPTIHRYAKEQFAVTIFDKSGNPIVRYDLWTEGFMSNWNQIVKNKDKVESDGNAYKELETRLQTIQNAVNKTININRKVDVENDIQKLYRVDSTTNRTITVAAPWGGDNEKIQKRITADMLGNRYEINNIIYNPNKEKKLKNYENSKFIEKFIEITTNGETVTDEGYSLETIKGNKKLEIIYILQ